MLYLRNIALLGSRYVFPKRMCSTALNCKTILEHLKERSLVRVAGSEVTEFLQGLITNDIHHLGQSSGGSMYTLFLNTKGRVLYDAIIYKSEEDNTYYIECDKAAVEPIQKHLKLYRVRRKIDVSGVDKEYTIHSLFNFVRIDPNSDSNATSNNIRGIIVPCGKLKSSLPKTSSDTIVFKDLMIFKDPRVVHLGFRVISKTGTDVKNQITEIVDKVDDSNHYENYKILRYSLGIGEGFHDLPVGNSFPLESNCDYLHGISFHKGCYIGQELTARTHHTGVIRKRLMPLFFSQTPTKLPTDNVIIHKNVNLGRIRGVERNVGLALLRISKALEFGEFPVGNGVAKVVKPDWWPIEAPKEKVTVERN